MKDLTQGSIAGHLISMALPTAAGMLFQTLYFFVDLYFVAGLGDAAVAGVSAAGNLMFIVLAMTHVLAVGTVAAISHAVGRKDQEGANVIFNQALLMGAVISAASMVLGYLLADVYLRSVAADEATVAQGLSYLYWFIPCLALQFATVAMVSALRGTGIVKPVLMLQVVTVVVNTILAPVLIAGWGTGYAMGVAGAGLASSIAVASGVVMLGFYFHRYEKYVTARPDLWKPKFQVWKEIFTIGAPGGGELAVMFFYTSITFWAISQFGSAAQAGFGIGSRIMQAIFLPALAVAAVVAPVAGQNYGARQMDRVRETFNVASIQSIGIMMVMMVICQWRPDFLIALFSKEPEVISIGATFLQLISWNFVLGGIAFVAAGIFQALGNTMPALLSSVLRVACFSIPLIWVTSLPNYKLEHIWYLSIFGASVQAIVSFILLQRQMKQRLGLPATQPV